MDPNEPTLDSLMEEFKFEVPELGTPIKPGIDIILQDDKTAEELEAEKKAAEEAAAAAGKTAEELEAEKKAAEEAAAAAGKTAEELKEIEAAKAGIQSNFKDLALKYMEKGKWDPELSVEDSEGNIVLVKDLEDIDEDTFFQLEEAIKAQEDEASKSNFISVEGVDDRKKTLIEIIKEGGELSKIFKDESQINEYLNPFENLDLDNEKIQEQVYLNALVKHNKLDLDIAQAVVEKAKKDLTLDDKVQAFVTAYTKNFEKYVNSEKEKLIEANKEAKKKESEFKKSLTLEYKKFDLKDTLSRKLANIATNKQKDGDYEIDSIYASKMESPEEAAELVLFLTDKETYLKAKLSKQTIKEHKKVRQTIKLVPKQQIKSSDTNTSLDDSEFKFKV